MNPNAKTSAFFALSLTMLLAAPKIGAQQLQKGVSVEMAATTYAQPMHAADDLDAWIVTVSSDGNLWFGVRPVTASSLSDEMIRTPRKRDQNLYIKADARAPYSAVMHVLTTAPTAGFETPVLLTAQPESTQPGTIVSPKGLEVSIGSEAISGAKPALVEVLGSKQNSPVLKLNGQAIPWSNFQTTLEQFVQQRVQHQIVLKADGGLPFAQVARVIDACRSTGVKVILATPEI